MTKHKRVPAQFCFNFSRLVLCFSCVTSHVWADQIVMKNGDRVTGSIVKKDGKDLTIKTDQFGLVTTSWDQVASIKIDNPVTVVLQDGRSVQGAVATNDGKVEVAAPGASVSVTPPDVTAIRNADEQKAYERLQHPGWLQLWAGTANIGLAGAAGNARTFTFATGFDASRVTRTDKTTIYFKAIKASALTNGKNEDTAQAVRGGIGYDHGIGDHFFLNTFNDWEYDRFQDLDLRFVIGAGIGYHAIKNARTVMDVLGGLDYTHAKFSTPLTTNAAEVYWGDGFTYKLSAATQIVQSFRMFNDLTDTGNFRINGDLSAATRVTKWMNWTLTVSDRYLHHPAPGKKTNDLLYTTGVQIKFAE
jgi:hypothetical protein